MRYYSPRARWVRTKESKYPGYINDAFDEKQLQDRYKRLLSQIKKKPFQKLPFELRAPIYEGASNVLAELIHLQKEIQRKLDEHNAKNKQAVQNSQKV